MIPSCILSLILLAGITAAAAQQGSKTDVCVREQANRYSAVCDSADVTARAVAHKCAPKPPRMPGQQPSMMAATEEIIHDWVYAQALVAIFELRADGAGGCKPKP
jgi:hypothetical protein